MHRDTVSNIKSVLEALGRGGHASGRISLDELEDSCRDRDDIPTQLDYLGG